MTNKNKIEKLTDFIDANLDGCADESVKLQVAATLIFAAQVERIADALDAMIFSDGTLRVCVVE